MQLQATHSFCGGLRTADLKVHCLLSCPEVASVRFQVGISFFADHIRALPESFNEWSDY